MNDAKHLLQGDDVSMGNRDRAVELALTLQTLGDFCTQDILDDLLIALLFAQACLALSLCFSISFYSTTLGCTGGLPPGFT
jgi:hypothetical protein